MKPTDQLIGFTMCWWEGREENYIAQVFPRLAPMVDVAWNPQSNRDFAQFDARYKTNEVTRNSIFYPVKIEASPLAVESDKVFHNETQVSLSTMRQAAEIRFTVDGSVPKFNSLRYENPFAISESTLVRAAAFVDGQQVGHGSRCKVTAVKPAKNLALGKPVSSSASSGPPFSVDRITDGGTGNLDFYLGYPATSEKPIAITVDLEEKQAIGKVVVHSYTISGSFEKYKVLVSEDGESFAEIGSRLEPRSTEQNSNRGVVEHEFDSRKVRFIRLLSEGNHGYVFDSFSKIVEIQAFEK